MVALLTAYFLEQGIGSGAVKPERQIAKRHEKLPWNGGPKFL
jgi:hypothetical protein